MLCWRQERGNHETMNHPDQLETAYITHHTIHARYGFSYRVAERGPRFAAWVGAGKRLLDLGCRDGNLTQYYASGNRVTGVDIDRQALALASDRLGIATVWLDLNRESLPFDDGSFDVVVAGELLEHLLDPISVVHEVYRVLAPGGMFIGSVPNSFHWRARLAPLRGRSMEDPTHVHRFSWSRIRQLLREFEDMQLVPVGGIGGRVLPVVPTWLSQPLVHALPQMLANDFLFRARRACQ